MGVREKRRFSEEEEREVCEREEREKLDAQNSTLYG